ncbi:DUF2855 family protein [Micromonospora cremea]|uniref:NADPH-dependent curcumin reductase CurA n=1 Tax=Micromonospora cremea TaxID=709881 RepID=A0A1N6ADD4_9ACTN|nr:DUF2855 family protein [Micromonospora cremea]SIN32021.1 Protein of unknown function [Micromonospora cremea]
MPASWTLAVARGDLGRTTFVDGVTPALSDGEALLRVDRVGLTANNVTYAVLGDSMRYWQFFPPDARGLGPQWGLPPLWGFAEVIASAVPEVAAGQRVYGYLPSAGHLVVRPHRVDASGFRDASRHRAELPSPYNAYRSTTGDSAYRPDQEDLLILFRPLFFTSFMLADQVVDNGFYGAASLVMSSASSKTAYATAFELHGRGPRLVGLTSPGNLAFTRSLGCYDEVLSYDDIGVLDVGPTVYLDLSGAPSTRAALRRHLGDQLVRDIAVGLTNQTPNADAAEEVFFAPVQMRKRSQEWGREGLDQRFTEAWQRFTAVVSGWLDVRVGAGPEALRNAWLEVLGGRTPPRVGHVVQL